VYGQRCKHHPAGLRGGFERKRRGVGGTAATEQLARERRPRGIRVTMVQFEAVQARAGPWRDERADLYSAVAEDNRQVRNIAAQPHSPSGWGEHVVADEHGGVGQLGAAFVDRCRDLGRIGCG